MKIGILSDTHNRLTGMDRACDIFEAAGVHTVIHCGDWTSPGSMQHLLNSTKEKGMRLFGVLGNNDTDPAAFIAVAADYEHASIHERVYEAVIGGKAFVIYHGHHKPTLREVLAAPCDVLCLGHSHKPRYDRLDPKIVLNPGSTAFSIPRSKQWQASVILYDTEIHEAEFVYFNV